MIAKPSASLSAKLEKEERDRIERRRADLGEEELKRLEEAVKKAKAESDKPPPDGMVEAFPLTDVSRTRTAVDGPDHFTAKKHHLDTM